VLEIVRIAWLLLCRSLVAKPSCLSFLGPAWGNSGKVGRHGRFLARPSVTALVRRDGSVVAIMAALLSAGLCFSCGLVRPGKILGICPTTCGERYFVAIVSRRGLLFLFTLCRPAGFGVLCKKGGNLAKPRTRKPALGTYRPLLKRAGCQVRPKVSEVAAVRQRRSLSPARN